MLLGVCVTLLCCLVLKVFEKAGRAHVYDELCCVDAGWHNRRLNKKDARGRLDLYQLAPMLHQKAAYIRLQVVLLSEHHRRVYRNVQHPWWNCGRRTRPAASQRRRRCGRVHTWTGRPRARDMVSPLGPDLQQTFWKTNVRPQIFNFLNTLNYLW